MRRLLLVFALLGLLSRPCDTTAAEPDAARPYGEIIAADRPVAYWSFATAAKAAAPLQQPNDAPSPLGPATIQGKVGFDAFGPAAETFPLFGKQNRAAEFYGDGGRIVLADPGKDSPLDFAKGDSITLEAWVNCTKLGNDQQVYLVGKGRTKNSGVAAENQNYALRLRGEKGMAHVSFLFRSADNRPGERDDFHRWNSKTGFPVRSGWHHVAVSYTFGEPKSIRGYLDGRPVDGGWDYGGATDEAPVVDDDEVWLGSSLGGNAGNSLSGQLDEVAIYRTALSPERIAARWVKKSPPSYVTPADILPADAFLVEVFEGIPDAKSWDFPWPSPSERYTEARLALNSLPHKYTAQGIRDDRTNPFVLRVSGRVELQPGDKQWLLRARTAARLFIDDRLAGEVGFSDRGGDGHNAMYPVDVQIVPGVRYLPTGDRETLIALPGEKRTARVTLEIFCGGRGRRPELGETVVARVPSLAVVGFGKPLLLSETSTSNATVLAWPDYLAQRREADRELNQRRRRVASESYTSAWNKRHDEARAALDKLPPPVVPAPRYPHATHNAIDRFLNDKLHAAGVEPLPLADDASFARRAALDTIGTPPPVAWLAGKLDRAALLDRLLAQPGWADHWTSYWQDVLAENPNIINPTLNNTGPFRWWIYESLVDNKPLDRFATELIMMEGSLRGGGAAGFAMSSQNDAPMAAKAQVIAQAFLGLEMKCARCHDAPYHDFTQKQLFGLAAMLKRGDESVPKTSTIPGDPAALKSLLVKVTLAPGEKIAPAWPFSTLVDDAPEADLLRSVRDPSDQRARLAALVTLPQNRRFAQVLVNRIWQRYFGRGLVEPVDDWEHPDVSHPELLAYLERELVASGYDMKHVARLILNSHAYQRQVDPLAATDRARSRLFAGPLRRRLTAEQVVDSLFAASGKPLNVEEINIDVDSTRQHEQSINLGVATRAWQLTSLSNERDRPSLSLPAAQHVVDLLEAFGWRSARPDPLTVRPAEVSPLQAALLANGWAAKRAAQLSDDSALTQLALEAPNLEAFIGGAFQRILVRPPDKQEWVTFTKLLAPGFDERIVAHEAPRRIPGPPRQTGVTWSNHLQPEASERKLALKAELEAGDPPTQRLAPDWRERAEDFIWTLFNSPEFVLAP